LIPKENACVLETPYRTSPFGPGFAVSGAGIDIAEPPPSGRIVLRGPAGDARFLAATRECLGIEAPPPPLKAASAGGRSVLGLGPDEWMVLCDADAPRYIVPKLREHLRGVHAAVVDVSNAFATLRLTGPRAVDLLRKGCSAPVDKLAPSGCMQTRVVRYTVLIHGTAPETLDLHVARSYARAFSEYMADAAANWTAKLSEPRESTGKTLRLAPPS
jgi:sarcosine oxidase subunit gamma